MLIDQDAAPADETPNFKPKLYGIGLLVAAIIISGSMLVGKFSAADLQRDMQTWREKLNLIAESRSSEVDGWVKNNFRELRTLADNPSLQLYMTELASMKDGDNKAPKQSGEPGEPSQKAYLRNLMLFTAQRAGFGAAGSSSSSIPANVQQGNKSGLAMLDADNNVVVSTVITGATKDLIIEHVKQSQAGQEGLIDIRKDKDGTPYIGFIAPVFSIQGDRNAESQIGRVVGIKMLDKNLYGLLKHPGTTEKTLEILLVRASGDKVEYLSPMLDGSEPLSKTMPFDTSKYAAAKLMQANGEFLSDQKDYRDMSVLATSRQIAGTPWSLIVKIDQQEALAESSARRHSMEFVFSLIIALFVLVVATIWWRGNSKRSMLLSGYFKKLAAKALAQEQLLRLVADHQPEPIYIVDSQQVVHFANQQASSEARMSVESMPGKPLADIRGNIAGRIADQCRSVLTGGHIAYDIQRIKAAGKERIIRSAYVPLAHIPVVTLPDHTPGVLIVEQDISEVMHEREQRLKTQRQLIEMLVTLVDKRDPFAAHHSKLVSQIAYEVAVEMELDSVTVETTSKSGSLMNIGKIMVPTELLTKNTALTMDEKRVIHDSINAAADLLDGISFDGPVAETLRQWQEKWDGTGPLGLNGESILISARIIAVANAFIGMISPRSWRTAIPIESANKFLLEQADVHFDRRVVIAMINFVENHSGREWINKIMAGQRDAA